MTNEEILARVEKSIKTAEEREYFLIHIERYRVILDEIEALRLAAIKQNPVGRLRVLDVGCFPYHLGMAMELMGFDVYGIASDHEPIRNKKISIINIEKDIFPFKDNFFDMIVFTEVLEHLPQSPLHALKEMYRVISLRGSLIVTTPNIARSINRAKMLVGKSVTYPLQQVLENEGTGSNIYHRHNREYTLHELSTLVTHAHFSLQKEKQFISYTPWRRRVVPDSLLLKAGKTANYALMLMIAAMRDTLLVVGTKLDKETL